MSTKEMLMNEISFLNEEQCSAVLQMIHAFSEIPNKQTKQMLKEAADMAAHPEQYPSYHSAEEMLEDILNEV